MTYREIMKYIESEYNIINSTPCHVCGGKYLANDLEVVLMDNMPYDVCECVCTKCGNEKTFEFVAPFIEDKYMKRYKKLLS
ncbi:MAG: metal-binding protein [Bacillota bacterium]|nr:metal-binding protein [Bacillota bacterium]